MAETLTPTKGLEERFEEYKEKLEGFKEQVGNKIDKDVQEFLNATVGGDELQVILRGHLYIEHELEKLLKIYMVEPELVLTERFMFMNKINLAIALGALSLDKKIPYKRLNDLRNKYVHQLKFKVSETDLNRLVDSFDRDLRGEISVKIWNEGLPVEYRGSQINKLQSAVLSLWTYLLKVVHVESTIKFKKKLEIVGEKYKGNDPTKIEDAYLAECEELFNKMQIEVGIMEGS
ncbi:hypothetical protein [Bacillus sp. AY2-1]|uniref:hypothetical protein n=1 Tax=Bacillus sp. AY2-1 TaxID=2217828 RepID=UPI0011F0681C|nr:hypothetical protein [Bacillus sp. AY2-1]